MIFKIMSFIEVNRVNWHQINKILTVGLYLEGRNANGNLIYLLFQRNSCLLMVLNMYKTNPRPLTEIVMVSNFCSRPARTRDTEPTLYLAYLHSQNLAKHKFVTLISCKGQILCGAQVSFRIKCNTGSL